MGSGIFGSMHAIKDKTILTLNSNVSCWLPEEGLTEGIQHRDPGIFLITLKAVLVRCQNLRFRNSGFSSILRDPDRNLGISGIPILSN